MSNRIRWIHWTPSLEAHTGRVSTNLGDQVIHAAAEEEVGRLLGTGSAVEISTKEALGEVQVNAVAGADFVAVGGSNLLSSHMLPTPLGKPVGGVYRQWKIGLFGPHLRVGDVGLVGVGWWRYQKSPDPFTRRTLGRILSRDPDGILHSVRDSYAMKMLEKCGFENVVNTGCVTMWGLHGLSDDDLPSRKADSVVFTLTDYRRLPEIDSTWVNLLLASYDRVFFWPQGRKDITYLDSLGLEGIEIIDGGVFAYSRFLAENDVDYVGTRLHGGIRALQNFRDALIFSVDNRSIEISRDTGLKVCERRDINGICKWIGGSRKMRIEMPVSDIDRWKDHLSARLTS